MLSTAFPWIIDGTTFYLSLFWVGFLTWGHPPNHPGLNGIFHQPAIGGSECQDSAGRCCATSPPTKRSWSTELILFVAEMRNRDFTSNNDVFTIRKLCFFTIKSVDFTKQHRDLTIKYVDVTIKHGDLT